MLPLDKAKKKTAGKLLIQGNKRPKHSALLTTVKRSVKYKPAVVNMLQTCGAQQNGMIATMKVSGKVAAMVSPKSAMLKIQLERENWLARRWLAAWLA